MIRPRSVHWKLISLFCITAGLLLAVSYAGLYIAFGRVAREQFDRRLAEVAAPIIADLAADPDDRDVENLNIANEYFEILDPSGSVLQRSRNLTANLPLSGFAGFQTIQSKDLGVIRATVIPFHSGESLRLFVAAASTREVEEGLAELRRFAAALLPASLLLTALVFGLFSSHLLARIDAVVSQLRQFVSDASHELRTPLAVLQGENELLLAKPRTTDDYRAAVRVMDSELKKLTRIVEGLFTLSMADAGQLRIAPELLYLEEVLEESCELATPLANAKKIRIERELERDVPFSGDSAFLRQLFLIFLDNAIKYSPSGSRILVKLTKKEQLQVSFHDQGVGIPEVDLPRIFERFFRGGASTEAQSGGLGLAIAQAIVQAHHGGIDCQSESGVGSIFTVRLPA